MRGRQLQGMTVLIVEPELEAALDIQDLLVDDGALVRTAYRLERAEELVQLPQVASVLVRRSVFDANRKLNPLLSQRQIPRVV